MNNQIIEMAQIMQNGEVARNRGDLGCTEFHTDVVVKVGLQRLAGAKALYNAGYRNAAEVAAEIIAEIDRMCIDTFGHFNHIAFALLKKKYTEDVK